MADIQRLKSVLFDIKRGLYEYDGQGWEKCFSAIAVDKYGTNAEKMDFELRSVEVVSLIDSPKFIAQRILSLTDKEATLLFYKCNTVSDLSKAVETIIETNKESKT